VKGLGYWTANLVLHTLGKVMALLEISQETSFTIVFGNVVTWVGSVLFLFGLAAFTETAISYCKYAIFTFVSACIISFAIVFPDNQLYRSIVHGSLIIFISVQYLRIIWKKRAMDPLFTKPFFVLFVLYSILILLFFYRTAGDLIALKKNLYMNEFDSNALRLSNLISLVTLSGVNFITLILSNNKLLSDLAQDAIEKGVRLEKLQVEVEHDGLTGVFNRSALEHVLDGLTATKKNERYMVCLVDIDCFKAINDTYGHEMGDRALIQLARIFRSITRSKDYVGRWGGDEFLLILTEMSDVHQSQFPERILEAVRAFDWDSRFSLPDFQLTVSLGFSCLQYPETKNILLKRCDQNLYRAKRQGKNSAIGDCC